MFRVLLLLTTFVFANAICNENYEYWQGGYLSGQFGYVWQRENPKFANANYFNTLGPQLLGKRFQFKSNKYIGGVAIGTNYQDGCFVTGYEAGALFLNQTKTQPSPFFPITDTFTSSLSSLANVKVRFGLAYHRLLAYISGGWAGGSLEMKLRDNLANIIAKKCRWVNGWIIGAGVEHKLWSCITLGVEYNYIQLSYRKLRLSCPSCGNGIGLGSPKVTNRHQIQSVCLRLNFILC